MGVVSLEHVNRTHIVITRARTPSLTSEIAVATLRVFSRPPSVVKEFLEGQMLREEMQTGLPLRKPLDYAIFSHRRRAFRR